jgi:DNA-binding PucR family transcriptional regulator
MRLADYDSKNGSDLVGSLRMWFRSRLDVSAAATALHVHHNTLRYRLKRAVEISGCDITQAHQLLALQLLLVETTPALHRGGEGPGQTGCAARDLNPEPAD